MYSKVLGLCKSVAGFAVNAVDIVDRFAFVGLTVNFVDIVVDARFADVLGIADEFKIESLVRVAAEPNEIVLLIVAAIGLEFCIPLFNIFSVPDIDV
jgi:hypothetical protein